MRGNGLAARAYEEPGRAGVGVALGFVEEGLDDLGVGWVSLFPLSGGGGLSGEGFFSLYLFGGVGGGEEEEVGHGL